MDSRLKRQLLTCALAIAVFYPLLGTEVQCTPAEARPSMESLQAQIDALTARVQELENPTPKKVFVTSQVFQGNFGGPDGADAICNQAAASASLSGSYRAWLGSASGGPNQRFRRSGPYALLDGTVIAWSWDGVTDGTLLAPISVDEFGQVIPPASAQPGTEAGSVWTRVGIDGNELSQDFNGNDCEGWSRLISTHNVSDYGATGDIYSTAASWTQAGYPGWPCTSQLHFYCFEQ